MRNVLFLAAFVGAAAANEPPYDRSTPRRALSTFVLAAEAGDYEAASTVLEIKGESQKQHAAELAERLHYILERNVWIDPAQISDAPEGIPGDGLDTERIGSVRVDKADVPITLTRRGEKDWVVSATTVARIPRLYEEHGPGWIESRVPASLKGRLFSVATWQWLGLALVVVMAFVAGRGTTWVLLRLFSGITKRTTNVMWDEHLVRAIRRPSRFVFGVITSVVLLEQLSLSAAASHIINRLLGIVSIGAAAWILIGISGVVSAIAERRATDTTGVMSTPRDSRAVRTQVRVLRRVINVAIAIVAVALMLTQFDIVRNVGVSLLASAGVAGVVLGFAAQRTFGSLIAGLQLSFTQPIRIGDVVVIEKEQGTIEEITLTFVVVRVWDERRLIVPMARFLEQPFENWTKVSPELHGTVFLFTDWRLPVDDLRAELDRILESNPLWDKRTKTVAVTGTTDRTLEVRILVSASDAQTLWLLRLQVREKLVAWLQSTKDGAYLPRLRLGVPTSPVDPETKDLA